MSTVETYLGGAQRPVGAIEFMHSGFTANAFTNRGQQWLRTGVLAAYDPAVHGAAAAAGLTVTQRVGGSAQNALMPSGANNAFTHSRVVRGVAGMWADNFPTNAAEAPLATSGSLVFIPYGGSGTDPLIVLDGELPNGQAISVKQVAYISSFDGFVTYSYDSVTNLNTLWVCKDGANWRSIGTVPLGTASASAASFSRAWAACQDILLVEYAGSTASNYCIAAFQFDAYGNIIGRAKTAQTTTTYDWLISSTEGWLSYTATATTTGYITYAQLLASFNTGTLVFSPTTITSVAAPAVGYANGTWVLLGGSATNSIHSGTSLTNITSRTTSSAATWTTLGWSGDYWVVAGTGASNTAAVSADAVTWTNVTTAASWVNNAPTLFRDILANSTDGYIELSTRVVSTRTNCSLGTQTIASNGASTLVMLGYDQIFTSTDGGKYWYSTYFGGATSNAVNYLKYTGGKFFAKMNTDLLQSSDGLSWSVVTHPLTGTFADIEWFGSNWYIGCNAASSLNYAYSTNLSSWTTGAIRTTASNVLGFLVAGTTLIAHTSTGGATSTNGTSWTNSTGGLTTNYRYDACTYDGTTAVAITYNGSGTLTRYTSVDLGANWTATTGSGVPAYYTATGQVVKFNGRYWMEGYQSTARGVFSSTDALTWSAQPTMVGLATQVAIPGKLAVVNNALIVARGTTAGNYGITFPVAVLDATGTAAYVGTREEVTLNNAIGYVRVA